MIITFVGRLIEAKGVQDLIKTFNTLAYPNLELWIVGDGNYRQELVKLANNNPKIVFYGEQSHDNAIDILKQSDIFVNPSYSEGLPTSVMEAASVGLPIIATDVGGTNEIIEHDKSGLLIIPRDIQGLSYAISLLLDFPNIADKLGKEAQKTVKEKFNWDSIVDQYLRLFKMLDKSVIKYME